MHKKRKQICCEKYTKGLYQIGKIVNALTTTPFFLYKGKNLRLLEHNFNCGKIKERMSERGIELAIAKYWLEQCEGDVIEYGAVTPYYISANIKIDKIVDPYDKHKKVTDKCSLFKVESVGKNILTISTVEHIGMGDYGIKERKNSIHAIKKILEESKHCLITYPIGYNRLLDNWTKRHYNDAYITIYTRGFLNNRWRISKDKKYKTTYGPLWANSIAVIEK